MNNDDIAENKNKSKLRILINSVTRFINGPLYFFPDYGSAAVVNFLSLAIYTHIVSVILFFVILWQNGLDMAWQRVKVLVLISVSAYAIGSILKSINANTWQLKQLRKDLSELKQDKKT